MKDSLKPGLRYEHTFKVPPSKRVSALYPESEEFLAMPEVFSTGFLEFDARVDAKAARAPIGPRY